MKANEVIDILCQYGKDFKYTQTCDTVKSGTLDKDVTKVAVAMFPTIDLVKEVIAWGAELLIVHEPTYYNHWEQAPENKVLAEKRAFLESSGLTIFRFHDHPHRNYPDLIAAGEVKYMNLDGEVTFRGDVFDLTEIKLNNPTTPLALAKMIEKNLGIQRIKLYGAINEPCTKISACFGAPGDVFDVLSSDNTEILLIGECNEWGMPEFVRDAASLGYKKAMLVLGHIGSERAGMVYTAELLKERIPDLDIKYFECGESHTFTH